MKQCTRCKEYKSETQFGSKVEKLANGSKAFYKRSHCRKCVNKVNLKRYHSKIETKAAHKTASYRHRIKSYGLTQEEYEKMLSDQNGSCYICKEIPKETLHIDHDHKTGKVRKLLCNSCNAALGHVGDNIKRLESLIEYIKEH